MSHAIVSAMQYSPLWTLLQMQLCPGLCINLTVHVCACVSERALNLIMQHEYSHILLFIAATAQWLNISRGSVVAERLRAPNSNSGVSDSDLYCVVTLCVAVKLIRRSLVQIPL